MREALVNTTKQLYHELCDLREKNQGDWEYSPVEAWKKTTIHRLAQDPNHIFNFRRSRIASGTMNFPDRPRGKLEQWFSGLPWRQRPAAYWTISKFLLQLRRVTPFRGRSFKIAV